jgi:hypothetical protein
MVLPYDGYIYIGSDEVFIPSTFRSGVHSEELNVFMEQSPS